MISPAKRIQKGIALIVFCCVPALAQQTAATPTFELSEIHPTPHTNTPYMTGGMLHGDRYLLHNASMVDMIALAYGLEADNVLGGPAWLDLDRFDVSARAPRGTSADDVKLMVRSLLADRFKLVLHSETQPKPSYVLRVDKVTPTLKQAEDGEALAIEEHHTPTDNPPGVPAYYSLTCHSVSMTRFREILQGYGANYINKPVVDATGLQGSWDFDLHWTSKPSSDGLSIFTAVKDQLGLKLALEKYPTPVVIVDSVNQKPTPNPPGIDKALPPPPPSEFEVVVLKASKPDAKLNARITGNQITATGVSLQFFVTYAYNINPNADDLIVNAPKFFKQDKWDLLAKASPESQATGPDGRPQFDFDLLPHMVQTMLAERFLMKSHLEDRPIDAFTLVAAGPKMKKADPLNRTGCKEGPGPDGKDPRIANPILGRLFFCQNMTMAQFAEQIPSLAGGYVFTPVLDATGLTDAYDFTLSFSTAGQLHSAPPPTAPGNDPGAATTQSDPNGGLSLQDARARQLGIKLAKRRRPVSVLVIDQIEEKPTEN
jgi:uncharacterized protein (TIGR03435 family)